MLPAAQSAGLFQGFRVGKGPALPEGMPQIEQRAPGDVHGGIFGVPIPAEEQQLHQLRLHLRPGPLSVVQGVEP